MLYAVIDSSRQIAFANFLMAIFILFTICLPLLLASRSNKEEANRDFLYSTFNPWYQSYGLINADKVIQNDLSIKTINVVDDVINQDNVIKLDSKQTKEEDLVNESISDELNANNIIEDDFASETKEVLAA